MSKEKNDEKADVLNTYILIFKDSRRPPMPIASSLDLIAQYLDQMKKKHKAEEWQLPIEFIDEDGDVVACFMAQEISGMAMGVPVSKTDLENQGVDYGRN